MAFKHVVCAVLVLALFDSISGQSRQSCRRRGAKKGPEQRDVEKLSLNATVPEGTELAKSNSLVRSTSYERILKNYKCSCSPSKPVATVIKIPNTCPSQTYYLEIGNYVDGCYVAFDFKNHWCPYTSCKNFRRCEGLKPAWGQTRCVQDNYKNIIFYAWCKQFGRWKLVKKIYGLPQCCSCKIFC